MVFASISKSVFLCIIPDFELDFNFFATLLLPNKRKTLVSTYKRFCVPRPGTSHRNHRKIKEFIFLIINYLNISYFLYFCHILPIFRYSVHF